MKKRYFAKQFSEKTLALAAGLLVFFLAGEALLWLGAVVREGFFRYRTAAEMKDKERLRILCLGESTTCEQWPRFLGAELEKRLPGKRFVIIDRGRPSITSSAVLEDLPGNLERYRPDLVISMTGCNDAGITGKYMRWYDIPRKKFKSRFLELMGGLLREGLAVLGPKSAEAAPAAEETGRGRLEEVWAEALRRFGSGMNEDDYVGFAEYFARDFVGNILGQEGLVRFAEAEAYFRARAGEKPEDLPGWLRLGFFYAYFGHATLYEQWVSAFRIAAVVLEKDPDNVFGLLLLADFYHCTGNEKNAGRILDRVMELGTKTYRETVNLVWCLVNTNRHGDAKKILTKALDRFPRARHEWCYGLASICLKEGRLAEAREYLLKGGWPENDTSPNRERALQTLEELTTGKKPEGAWTPVCPVTIENHEKMYTLLREARIPLVCVQYPMRSVRPLMEILGGRPGVFFVDNERLFKDRVRSEGYHALFVDNFAGDFGHCTDRGNRLLAANIARVVAEEVFAAR